MLPAITRVVAIRHGETAWNVDKRIQGQLDIPLSERGRWQAERLAAALADEGIDVIYSSDLQRAQATASALARITGCELRLHAGLRERAFGRFEGRTFRQIDEDWPDDARRWRQREPDFVPQGGESLEEFNQRCLRVCLELVAAHPDQSVALVAHGGVLDCLYRAATRVHLQVPRSWQLDNATINRLLFNGRDFSLVGWNDHHHFDGEPPGP